VTALFGRTVRWRSPAREDTETTWRHALRRHGVHTLIGVLWAALVWWLNPSYLWWLLPVVGALVLSIPLSVYTSRVGIGRWLRRNRFFLIPEEAHPPPEIRLTRKYVTRAAPAADAIAAVVDPRVNALACANGVARFNLPAAAQQERHGLVARALEHGIDALTPAERATLIGDPLALSRLHFAMWTDTRAHQTWRSAIAEQEVRGPVPAGIPPQVAPAQIAA
jgi:membrane glycosyltransferase